jgi:hypothetical protein
LKFDSDFEFAPPEYKDRRFNVVEPKLNGGPNLAFSK